MLPPKRYFEKLLESSRVQAGQILFPKLEVAAFNKKGRSGGVDICYGRCVFQDPKSCGLKTKSKVLLISFQGVVLARYIQLIGGRYHQQPSMFLHRTIVEIVQSHKGLIGRRQTVHKMGTIKRGFRELPETPRLQFQESE